MLGFDLPQTTSLKRFEQQFIDLGRIGSGGFSNVHRVKSKLDHRQYALKIVEIRPNQCKQEVIDLIHKYLEEVKVLSHLNHKNVIEYNSCWIESDCDSNSVALDDFELIEKLSADDEEYEMVVEDFSGSLSSSGGIEFYNSQQQQLNSLNYKSRSQANSSKLKENSTQDRICNQQTNPAKKNSVDSQIKQKYSSIKIFILCESCESSLQSFIFRRNKSRKDQKISPSTEMIENYKMILQIVEGLQYLHSKKIIHRDMKLHNIVLDKTNTCKIIDYGLSKKARMLHSINNEYEQNSKIDDEEADQIFSSSVGTRIYSSPEQISSERYDHRTDIFSLAIVIVLFFSKFTTSHEELEMIQKIRKGSLDFVEIDERLKIVLKRCLSQEKNRPSLQSIRKLIKCLLRQYYSSESPSLTCSDMQENDQIISKEESVYIVKNNKLKKKMSKDEFFSQPLGSANINISTTPIIIESKYLKI